MATDPGQAVLIGLGGLLLFPMRVGASTGVIAHLLPPALERLRDASMDRRRIGRGQPEHLVEVPPGCRRMGVAHVGVEELGRALDGEDAIKFDPSLTFSIVPGLPSARRWRT